MIKSYERLKKLNKEKTRVPRTVQDTIPVDTSIRMVFFVLVINIQRVIAS